MNKVEQEKFDYFAEEIKKGAICYAKDRNGNINGCTVAWGTRGRLFSKEIITVFIKPNRYTSEFLKNSDTFSLSFFPENEKETLKIFGTLSGRDFNKFELAHQLVIDNQEGLHFEKAKITYIMQKIYFDQIDPNKLINQPDVITHYYQNEPYHYIFVGEIINVIEKSDESEKE